MCLHLRVVMCFTRLFRFPRVENIYIHTNLTLKCSPSSVLQDWQKTRFFFEDMKEELINKFSPDANLPHDEAAIKNMLANEPRHVSAELRFQKVRQSHKLTSKRKHFPS